MGYLDGKVAIVTGAGRLRGIGRATAVALASEGADVVVTGTGRDPSAFPDHEKQAGWKDVESTALQVRERGRRALTELDETVWRKVLEIKLTGAFLLCKRIVPIMVRQKSGRIVNLSSVAGKRGAPNTAAYNVANFGIQGLTQSLAMELARQGVTVNAICPGIIDTARMDVLGRGAGWQDLVERIPMGRAATDEEVAGLIAFLCSPSATYMTGQSINIDGGLVMW